jgi:hypothetical protein
VQSIITWAVVACVAAILVMVGISYAPKIQDAVYEAQGGNRATLQGLMPTSWDLQMSINVQNASKSAQRDRILTPGLMQMGDHRMPTEKLDEILVVANGPDQVVLFSFRTSPSASDLPPAHRKNSTYEGTDIYHLGGMYISYVGGRVGFASRDQTAIMNALDRLKRNSSGAIITARSRHLSLRTKADRFKAVANAPTWLGPFDSLGVDVDLQGDGAVVMNVIFDASSPESARGSIGAMDKLKSDFTAQMAGLKSLIPISQTSWDKLASAVASNPVSVSGSQVSLRLIVPSEIFSELQHSALLPATVSGSSSGGSSQQQPPPKTVAQTGSSNHQGASSGTNSGSIGSTGSTGQSSSGGPPRVISSLADKATELRLKIIKDVGTAQIVTTFGIAFPSGGREKAMTDVEVAIQKASPARFIDSNKEQEMDQFVVVAGPVAVRDVEKELTKDYKILYVDEPNQRLYIGPK